MQVPLQGSDQGEKSKAPHCAADPCTCLAFLSVHSGCLTASLGPSLVPVDLTVSILICT